MGRFDYPGLLTRILKTEHMLLRIIENIILLLSISDWIQASPYLFFIIINTYK